MRVMFSLVACAALAACSPGIPDSGSGVGFDDYDAYLAAQRAREAALTGSALPPPATVSSETLAPSGGAAPVDDAATLAAEARAALSQTRANSGVPVVNASPDNPPPQTVENANGISSENNFDAVGAQRSIEADAALIARNKAQYEVVAPAALPTRSGSGGPNLVDFALGTSNPPGISVYNRSGFGGEAKAQRNCAKYASSDQAQLEFLQRGGPERDRLGLDPDGDGFACGWDPRPFRLAVTTAGGA